MLSTACYKIMEVRCKWYSSPKYFFHPCPHNLIKLLNILIAFLLLYSPTWIVYYLTTPPASIHVNLKQITEYVHDRSLLISGQDDF